MELKLENFKLSLVAAINESGLPLSLISYVIKDTLQEVEHIRQQDLKKEKEVEQKTQLPVQQLTDENPEK